MLLFATFWPRFCKQQSYHGCLAEGGRRLAEGFVWGCVVLLVLSVANKKILFWLLLSRRLAEYLKHDQLLVAVWPM